MAQELWAKAAGSAAQAPGQAPEYAGSLAPALISALAKVLEEATTQLAQQQSDCCTAGRAWQDLATACTAVHWVLASLGSPTAAGLSLPVDPQAELEGEWLSFNAVHFMPCTALLTSDSSTVDCSVFWNWVRAWSATA